MDFPSWEHRNMLRNKCAVRTVSRKTTKKSEDGSKDSVNCDTDSSITGYNTSSLNTDEKFLYYAYNYGWEKAYRRQDYTPSDPGRLWCMPRFVDQAEAYFLAQIIADKCVSSYGTDHCTLRWRKTGFLCFEQCKLDASEYAPPTAGSAPAGVRHEPWKYRVAAAYRWTFDNGKPMPNEYLDNKCQRVVDLVAAYEGRFDKQDQDQARAEALAKVIGDGKNSDGTPTPEAVAYVELCTRQVAANVKQFHDRSTHAFGEPRPNPVTAPPAPRPRPNHPDTRSIEELLKTLGVRATEAPP